MQEAWHRRHAVQIVSALPEETEDALMVLELAKELVEGFLARTQRPARVVLAEAERGDRDRVVSLSSAIKGANF